MLVDFLQHTNTSKVIIAIILLMSVSRVSGKLAKDSIGGHEFQNGR